MKIKKSKKSDVNQVSNLNNLDNISDTKDLDVNSRKLKHFLAGFIEGKGSLFVSVRQNKNSKFGRRIDPEFHLYHNAAGLPLLKAIQRMFGTGTIFSKSGSGDTYVYAIRNRRSIKEKVIPYFEKHIICYSCKYSPIFEPYKRVVTLLENKEHTNLDGFLTVIEYSYILTQNRSDTKQNVRKTSLKEIKQEIFRDYMPKGIKEQKEKELIEKKHMDKYKEEK